MLPIICGTLACIYVAGVASAVGILGAFERHGGGEPDYWAVSRVAFGWPLWLVLACGVWLLFRRR